MTQFSASKQFDSALIGEYFSKMQRQGPGSDKCTLKALSFVTGLDKDSVIADLGCGTGGQTVVIAENTCATVYALDLSGKFLDVLRHKTEAKGLSKRVKPIKCSMSSLPFAPASIDIIWCEGAVYNIGFKYAINYWRPFLKRNGWLVVNDTCWLTPTPTIDIKDFRDDSYAEVCQISDKVMQLSSNGYRVESVFAIDDDSWAEYYAIQHSIQEEFLQRHPDNPTAYMIVENQRRKEQIREKHKEEYGDVFFIAKAI